MGLINDKQIMNKNQAQYRNLLKNLKNQFEVYTKKTRRQRNYNIQQKKIETISLFKQIRDIYSGIISQSLNESNWNPNNENQFLETISRLFLQTQIWIFKFQLQQKQFGKVLILYDKMERFIKVLSNYYKQKYQIINNQQLFKELNVIKQFNNIQLIKYDLLNNLGIQFRSSDSLSLKNNISKFLSKLNELVNLDLVKYQNLIQKHFSEQKINTTNQESIHARLNKSDSHINNLKFDKKYSIRTLKILIDWVIQLRENIQNSSSNIKNSHEYTTYKADDQTQQQIQQKNSKENQYQIQQKQQADLYNNCDAFNFSSQNIIHLAYQKIMNIKNYFISNLNEQQKLEICSSENLQKAIIDGLAKQIQQFSNQQFKQLIQNQQKTIKQFHLQFFKSLNSIKFNQQQITPFTEIQFIKFIRMNFKLICHLTQKILILLLEKLVKISQNHPVQDKIIHLIKFKLNNIISFQLQAHSMQNIIQIYKRFIELQQKQIIQIVSVQNQFSNLQQQKLKPNYLVITFKLTESFILCEAKIKFAQNHKKSQGSIHNNRIQSFCNFLEIFGHSNLPFLSQLALNCAQNNQKYLKIINSFWLSEKYQQSIISLIQKQNQQKQKGAALQKNNFQNEKMRKQIQQHQSESISNPIIQNQFKKVDQRYFICSMCQKFKYKSQLIYCYQKYNCIMCDQCDYKYFFDKNIQMKKRQELFNEQYQQKQREKQKIVHKQNQIKMKINVQETKIQKQIAIVPQKQKQIIKKDLINFDQLLKSKSSKNQNSEIPLETEAGKQVDIHQYFSKTQRLWEELDQITQKDPEGDLTVLIYKNILNKESTPQKQQQKVKQSEKISKQVYKPQDSKNFSLLCLSEYLKSISNQIKVQFCQKSNLQSKISAKIIATGLQNFRHRCTQKINDGQSQWTYEKIASNPKQFELFQKWYINRLKSQNNLGDQEIRITTISKGSINVQFQIKNSILSFNNKNIKIHPYFEKYSLCLQDFDATGDITFGNAKNNIQFRGKWPYYQPINAKRLGIRVLDQYDNKNNIWLGMANCTGEWVVAFHGVQYPTNLYQNTNMQVLSSIMKGRQQGKMLTAGPRQVYNNTKSVNKNQNVGSGIYCTPHLSVALQYTRQSIDVKGEKYYLVFQCRVNPKKIQIVPGMETYWVVNKPQDIRPYGMVLIKEKDRSSYLDPMSQFNEIFTYAKYKNQIDQTQY